MASPPAVPGRGAPIERVTPISAWIKLARCAGTDPFNKGLLWRVSRAGIADSFVFGTIQVSDPHVSALPKPVEEALGHARTLAIELVPEAADGEVAELEQLADGGRLEPLSRAFAELTRQLAAQNIAPSVLEHLKPWAAMVKVTRVAGSGNGESLDQQLLAAARSRGLRVVSLELVDEQIAAFDAVPLDSQVAILQHALAHRDALAATIDPTVDAWLHGDLAGLDRITRRAVDAFPGLALHYRRLAKHLIDDRTKLMHYRLFMPLREGRVFTAIGATHPHGERGLLTMLERDGYRVTWIR